MDCELEPGLENLFTPIKEEITAEHKGSKEQLAEKISIARKEFSDFFTVSEDQKNEWIKEV